MKIRSKFFLIFSFVTLLTGFSLVYLNHNRSRDVFFGHFEDVQNFLILTGEELVGDFLKEGGKQVLLLSQLQTVREFIVNEDSDKNREMLEEDFLSFARTYQNCYQVRYLDLTGQEIVRIDQKNSVPEIVPLNKLQNKGDRYYFQQSIGLTRGEVFISQLDLNLENGKIENRGTEEDPIYVPVIRYATPVFDENVTLKGVVVLNLYADDFLQKLQKLQKSQNDNQKIYLINSDGYYLFHDSPEKSWGFALGKEETFFKDYPAIAQRLFFGLNKEQFIDEEAGLLVEFKYIEPFAQQEVTGASAERKGWRLVSMISLKNLNGQFNENVFGLILEQGLLLVLALMLAIFLAKSLTDPIKELTTQVNKVRGGNFDSKVIIKSRDEIGTLADAFNMMIKRINKDKSSIEEEIKKRTRQLEALNQHMVGRESKMIELKNRLKAGTADKKVSENKKRTKNLLKKQKDEV